MTLSLFLHLITLGVVLLFAIFCLVQSYLRISDAIHTHHGRNLAALGGSAMFLLSVALWFLFVYLVQHGPFA